MKAVRVTYALVASVFLFQAFDITCSFKISATTLASPDSSEPPPAPTSTPYLTTTTPPYTTAIPHTTPTSPPTTEYPNTTTTPDYTSTTPFPPLPTTTPIPTTTTIEPPTPTPCPPYKPHFDVLSFMGGIVLTIGIEAIVYILWIFCKHSKHGKPSYNRL